MAVDTEITELRYIDYAKNCGVNKQGLHDSFALHDNDLGSHVLLPFLIAISWNEWIAIILAYLYESMAVFEKTLGFRFIHSTSSYTGIVDGLLQDPAAAYLAVFFLYIFCLIANPQKGSFYNPIKKFRTDLIKKYTFEGETNWIPKSGLFRFILFSWIPSSLFHNLLSDVFGVSVSTGPLHIWTMTFSWLPVFIHAWYVNAFKNEAFLIISFTWVFIFIACLISYLCFYSEYGTPSNSTFLWIIVVFFTECPFLYFFFKKKREKSAAELVKKNNMVLTTIKLRF